MSPTTSRFGKVNIYCSFVGADALHPPVIYELQINLYGNIVGANVLGCPKRKQSSHRRASVPPPLHKEGKIKAPLCKGSCHESD